MRSALNSKSGRGAGAAASSGSPWCAAALLAVMLAASPPVALAQNAPAAGPPQGVAPSAKAKPPAGGDNDLRRRVEQLEEQLVDLQVVIGTLESLARSGGGAAAPRVAAPAGLSAGDNARIDGLEVQIRALTSQIEQLQSGRTAATGPAVAPPPASQFGSATVNAGQGDPIGGLLAQGSADGAAQAGFTDFLKSYPRDSLVPNALYWLGETHYVQRNYADAAEAFDLVTQGFGNSPKAPDSMLKRGMALALLGKKPEACGVLGQLPAKYPSASQQLKSKADSERQRIGCN